MRVEIRHLKNLKEPLGTLLQVVEVNAHVLNKDQVASEIASVLIEHGIRVFGDNVKMIKNSTIFGGHASNSVTGESIIAV